MSNNQSNLKNNFFNKIKNKKIFKNEIVLAVFNFALTLVTLIVLIAIMIASKSSNHITNIILAPFRSFDKTFLILVDNSFTVQRIFIS